MPLWVSLPTALMKLELNPETVHGVPAVVAAIVIALWDGAAVSRRAKSGWIGSDSWYPDRREFCPILANKELSWVHARCIQFEGQPEV